MAEDKVKQEYDNPYALVKKFKLFAKFTQDIEKTLSFNADMVTNLENKVCGLKSVIARLSEKKAEINDHINTRVSDTEQELNLMKGKLQDDIAKARADRASAASELASAQLERKRASQILEDAMGDRRQAATVTATQVRRGDKD